jgi:two-component system response regulator RegA
MQTRASYPDVSPMCPLPPSTGTEHDPCPKAANPVALLLDEDSSGRRRLANELTAHGFDVVVSDDADVGIALALQRLPALVVLELRLRNGAGLDLLTSLRAELPASRFVVLTSYGSVASAVRAMRLGASNYLCKPATIIQVLRPSDPRAANDLTNDPAAASLTLDEAIWEYIHETVESAGSLSEAARRLGLWRQSLKRMIDKYRPRT